MSMQFSLFHRGSHSPAFTLIELLVVVAIITLLIAILLPTHGAARKRSRTVVCSSIMSQWGKGIMAYATSNDGALPAKGNEGTTAQPVGTWSDPTLWFNAIPSQLNSAGLSYNDLQLASKPLNPNGPDLPVNAANSLFVCPEAIGAQGSQLTDSDGDPPDQTNGPYFIQYGLTPAGGLQSRNSFICYGWNSKLSSGGVTPKLTQIPSPDTITLMEKRMRIDEIGPTDPQNPLANNPATNYYPNSLVQLKAAWSRFTTRHNLGGNLLFIDGHAEFATYRDVTTPSVLPTGAKGGDWNRPAHWIWNPTAPAGRPE